jgi:hypothetical protein
MYAGMVFNSSQIKKLTFKNLVLFTVGLADPKTTDYSTHLEKMFPKGVPENTKVFHLRGGIDYTKLSFMHKKMMGMLKTVDSKEKNPSEEEQLFVSTYGGMVDFSDRDSIKPLVEYVKSLQV